MYKRPLSVQSLYSAVYSFWPVEELEELAKGVTGSGEVVRGGCMLVWNFSVTRLTVLTDADRRTRPNMRLSLPY